MQLEPTCIELVTNTSVLAYLCVGYTRYIYTSYVHKRMIYVAYMWLVNSTTLLGYVGHVTRFITVHVLNISLLSVFQCYVRSCNVKQCNNMIILVTYRQFFFPQHYIRRTTIFLIRKL